jgi:hypothetical protein
MVRKVNQLRSKKPTEQIKTRNEKKAERLVQEIHELKVNKNNYLLLLNKHF